jgi:aspartyl-tRNA(Asn)/glutamyl-tRNA(Gln) amidotransferase subunit A
MRLGKPTNHFYDDLDDEVKTCVEAALFLLTQAGAEIIPIEIPEVAEIDPVYAHLVPAELIAMLGRDKFIASKDLIDPAVWARAQGGLDLLAIDYIQLRQRHNALRRLMEGRMRGFAGWVVPTCPGLPVPLSEHGTVECATNWTKRISRTSRPGNLFGQCGISIPIHMLGSSLPVGLQILCPPNKDSELLSIGLAIEQFLGRPSKPDVRGFASGSYEGCRKSCKSHGTEMA